MTYQFRALADQAMADGAITAEEILGLRRAGWGDGRFDPTEAGALFTLNNHLVERTPEWVDFFVEALAEFILAGGSPRGFVSEAQTDWLIGQLDADGRTETMAELELLARLFEKAELVPERLKGYALNQLEQIVLTGTGPTRDGGQCDGARITPTECRLLRRFVFAFAGAGNGGVSQTEAELLFRIKDATLGAENAPEWQTLFVQGVANHLMAWNGYTPVSADKAVELEAFMNDTIPRVGAFFGRMAKAEFGKGVSAVLGFGRKGVAAAEHNTEVAGANNVTETEDAWLQAKIDADGSLDPLEKALLRFIAEEERN
jgi:hypothetical protein